VRLCLAEAEALGVPMVVGEAVRQMFSLTQARFGPSSDFTEIARLVEEWADVRSVRFSLTRQRLAGPQETSSARPLLA
jgi:hypothetical protein